MFYDYDFKHELIGEFLPAKFQEVFGQQSDYVAMLISKTYIERIWPRAESRVIIDRMLKVDKAFVLPIRFDDTELPGLVNSLGYADARNETVEQIGSIICERIGIKTQPKLSNVPPPHHANLIGTLDFDYSRHDGRYVLGDSNLFFETVWSSSGNDSIVAYNDGPNIIGVALADGASKLSEILDAGKYNYTSRSCRPKVGEFVIFQNESGFFCAVKLIEVQSRGHGCAQNFASIAYTILPSGRGNFSAANESK